MGNLSLPNLEIFRKKTGCIISTLPFSPEQRESFNAVMDEDQDEFPNVQIEDIVNNEWGINLKKTALSAHRRKKCLCFRGNPARDQENE